MASSGQADSEEAVHTAKAQPSREGPSERTQVSGAELEARFARWSTQRRDRREARTPDQLHRAGRRNLLIGTGAATLALIAGITITGESADQQQAANAARIDELESALMQSDDLTPEAGEVQDDVGTLVAAMQKDAETVAELQQHFAQLYREASTQPDLGNGTPSEAMLAIPEHRRTLAPHFLESELIAGPEAYDWSTADPIGIDNRIDPRYAWFVRYDSGDASAPEASLWDVETVSPALGRPGEGVGRVGTTGTAVWACRETATGEVLAWASAQYAPLVTEIPGVAPEGVSGHFSDLTVTVTTLGAQHRPGGTEGS